MLKGAVVGGSSLVFTRYHEAGATVIRSHQIKNPKPCRKILGYDANALYLSTMAKDMPCGKGLVVRYKYPTIAAQTMKAWLKSERWFGYGELYVEIPKHLHEKFEEMPPFFINKEVPAVEMVPRPRRGAQGSPPDHRLPAGQALHVVRGAGNGGSTDG